MLTRLTAALAHTSAELAMEQATAKVTDRFGGTRIATSVPGPLSSRRGNACRGAIVLIASDGWDSDPPRPLGRRHGQVETEGAQDYLDESRGWQPPVLSPWSLPWQRHCPFATNCSPPTPSPGSWTCVGHRETG